MSESSIHLSASQAHYWMGCSRKQQHRLDNPDLYTKQVKSIGMSVGPYVGNAVHRRVAEHKFEQPEKIIWDENTKSLKEARRQINKLYESYIRFEEDLLNSIGSLDIRREQHTTCVIKKKGVSLKIAGTIDCVYEGKDDYIIADIKTGIYFPPTVWQQLSLYTWLWKQVSDKKPYKAIMLWGKRGGSGDLQTYEKPPEALLPQAEAIIDRMIDIALHGTIAVPSEFECSTCLDKKCALRCVDLEPKRYDE